MTHAEWLQVCADISRLWPHAPMPPEAAEAWFPLLADLDGTDVARAVREYAMAGDHRFPPSVGAIRKHAQPPDRDWHEALADLRTLASRHGAHEPKPAIADPALDAVVESYGWRGACAIDISDPAARAQFRDAYRDARARVAREQRHQRAELAAGDRLAIGDGA